MSDRLTPSELEALLDRIDRLLAHPGLRSRYGRCFSKRSK